MTAVDALALPLANSVLECLLVELMAAGAPVCRGYVAHATAVGPPMDGATCSCDIDTPAGTVTGQGEAWVKVTAITPAVATPAARSRSVSGRTVSPGCRGNRFTIGMALGVYRCASTAGEEVPSATSRSADAARTLADAAVMRSVLRCPALANVPLAAGAWSPIGPSGDGIGGAMTFTVEVSEC